MIFSKAFAMAEKEKSRDELTLLRMCPADIVPLRTVYALQLCYGENQKRHDADTTNYLWDVICHER